MPGAIPGATRGLPKGQSLPLGGGHPGRSVGPGPPTCVPHPPPGPSLSPKVGGDPPTPAGLPESPTAPGRRPPLFYTKLKTGFYERRGVPFSVGGAEEMATDLQPCVSSPKLPSPAGEAGRGLRSASPAPCGRLSSAVPRKVGPDNRPAPRALCALQEAVSQMEASGTQPPHRQGWGDLRPPSL